MADDDTDTIIDAYVIAGLDFEPVLPCEHSMHTELHKPVESPGHWFIVVRCPNCTTVTRYVICEPGRAFLLSNPVARCRECSHIHPTEDAVVSIDPIKPSS